MTTHLHPLFEEILDSAFPGVRREAAHVEEPCEACERVICPRRGRKEPDVETDTYWCPECVALGLEKAP